MRLLKTPIEIIFEDDHLLVVNKPSGLPSHETRDKNRPHLISSLKEKAPRLILLHRLDVDTSGLVILSKTNQANLNLQNQLQSRKIKKIYWAASENLIDNHLPLELRKTRLEILQGKTVAFKNYLKLLPQNKRELSFPVQSGGDVAISIFRCLKQNLKWITFEVELITGRKHQIRSHLKSLNWPILGDHLYNDSQRIAVPRLGLHSWKLEFHHPMTGENLRLEATRPEEFSEYL